MCIQHTCQHLLKMKRESVRIFFFQKLLVRTFTEVAFVFIVFDLNYSVCVIYKSNYYSIKKNTHKHTRIVCFVLFITFQHRNFSTTLYGFQSKCINILNPYVKMLQIISCIIRPCTLLNIMLASVVHNLFVSAAIPTTTVGV